METLVGDTYYKFKGIIYLDIYFLHVQNHHCFKAWVVPNFVTSMLRMREAASIMTLAFGMSLFLSEHVHYCLTCKKGTGSVFGCYYSDHLIL